MAILSSIFGRGTPTPQVPGQVISTENIPKELQPYYKDILSKAQALYNDRVADPEGNLYQGQTLAEFTPEQQQAQTGIAGLVGTQAPIYQEAMGMTREAATPFTAEQVEEYMSPYQQAVTDIEKREATKQYQTQVVPQLAAQAAQNQAFGGSRQAILEGMAADTQQRLLSDLQAKGSANAYTDAIARLDADRLAKGQAGTQLANLGTAQYKGSAAEFGGLQLVGENKQRQNQTALNEAFKQFLDEREQPYVDMSKYQDVVRGAPIGKTIYSDPTPASYGPSLGTQLLGGIGGLNSIYGTFTGRNLAGQTLAPGTSGLKTGGGIGTLVKRANGTQIGNEIEDIKSTFEIDEDMLKQNTGNTSAPMVNRYLNSLGTVEDAYARARKSQEKNTTLAKEQMDTQKASFEADKQNAAYYRTNAMFDALAGLSSDPDVTNAPGGGAGQLLTILGKVGSKVGASDKEQRAKLRETQKNLIDLEMQYNKALADGDMATAVQLSEVMKGGAGVEIDIGTLNATLSKYNKDNTFEALKLAKVSEPIQKDITLYASNLLGFDAIYDPVTKEVQSSSNGKLIGGKDSQTLAKVLSLLQNVYANALSQRGGNQAQALADTKSFANIEDLYSFFNTQDTTIPQNKIITPQIKIPNKINTSILDGLNLSGGSK